MLTLLLNTLALLGGYTTAFPMDTPVFTDTANNIVVRQVSCAPVHIIIARASTEPPGPGMIGALAEQVIQANPGATNESIDYPATLSDYQDSSEQGTAAMTRTLTDYANACPCAQIVLMGYSQGAHVVGDTLCGGGGVLGNAFTPPIDKAIGDRGEVSWLFLPFIKTRNSVEKCKKKNRRERKT